MNETEDVEIGGNEEYEGDDDNFSDPNYNVETEREGYESLSDDDIFVDSDEELAEYRENCKKVQHDMSIGVNNVIKAGMESFPRGPIASDESDFGSWRLRPDYSSSEDENSNIGYIGPPNPKKRRTGRPGFRLGENQNAINWHVGMKFASMQEFRDTVREYGIKERRGVKFVTSDASNCQVCCEAECRFYIWCSKDKDSD